MGNEIYYETDEIWVINNGIIEPTENDIQKINTYLNYYSNKNVDNVKFRYGEEFFSRGRKIGTVEIRYKFTKEELEELDYDEEYDDVYEATCDIREKIQSEIVWDIDNLIKFTNREFKAIKERN